MMRSGVRRCASNPFDGSALANVDGSPSRYHGQGVKRDAFLLNGRLFSANTDGGSGAGGSSAQGDPGNGGAELTWDTIYSGLDDAGKKVVDSHISGLSSALEKERSDRRTLEKQIKDLSGKAEKGSEMETKLAALTSELEEANRRASFVAGASGQGVINPVLAYLAAREAKAFDESGNTNWARLKELHPELFKPEEKAKAGGRGDAGGGNDNGKTGFSFNDWLRREAGIG